MHHVGIALARSRLSNTVLNRAVANGEMFNPQSAKEAGFLDAVVPPEELMNAANAMAQHFKKINPKAHTQTKLKMRQALLDSLDSAIELDKVTGLV
jgi:enoyl-CoA hydratase